VIVHPRLEPEEIRHNTFSAENQHRRIYELDGPHCTTGDVLAAPPPTKAHTVLTTFRMSGCRLVFASNMGDDVADGAGEGPTFRPCAC